MPCLVILWIDRLIGSDLTHDIYNNQEAQWPWRYACAAWPLQCVVCSKSCGFRDIGWFSILSFLQLVKLGHWQQSKKLHICFLSTSEVSKLSLFFLYGQFFVLRYRLIFKNCHIWAWKLAIIKIPEVSHILSCTTLYLWWSTTFEYFVHTFLVFKLRHRFPSDVPDTFKTSLLTFRALIVIKHITIPGQEFRIQTNVTFYSSFFRCIFGRTMLDLDVLPFQRYPIYLY